MPSLKQLNEAIASYRADHPDVLMTVVVDATFGHRIDSKEVAEFEKAIETNAFVAPPAGAVGRGDGFILSIAQKANASILSNDSYQEFHGEYTWLFDEGRLIGGKPVPHVGWVWVNRVPVRGPVSRRSVKEQKIVEKSPGRRRGQKPAAETPSISANAPMPVPTSAPPGAVMPGSRRGAKPEPARADERAKAEHAKAEHVTAEHVTAEQAKTDHGRQPAAKTTNDLLAFLSFVEHFPVGTAVTGVVESYSSHGAYVLIGDVHGYVPLRLMADPAPRSAREAMDLGETVTLVVSSFGAARRSIDLAVPSMAPVVIPAAPKARRGTSKQKQAAEVAAAQTAAIEAAAIAAASPEETAAIEQVAPPAKGRKRAAKSSTAAAKVKPKAKAMPAEPVIPATNAELAAVGAAPTKKSGPRRPSKAAATPAQPQPTTTAKAAPRRAASRRVPTVPAEDAASAVIVTPAPADDAPARPVKKAPARRRAPKTNSDR